METNMKYLISSFITIALVISLYGAFSENTLSNTLSVLLLGASVGLLVYFRTKRMLILLLMCILLTFVNLTHQRIIFENSVSKKEQSETTVDNEIQKFEMLMMASSTEKSRTTGDIQVALKSLMDLAESKKSTSSPKSYYDAGRVYEIAAVLGVTNASNEAYKNYIAYCQADVYNPECYAVLAKFLAMDPAKRSDALGYAKKALSMSKTRADAIKYNTLVEYLSK
jgi:hypothetical protein